MSVQCEVTTKKNSGVKIGFFERYLTLWVFICIIVGIALGHWFPAPFQILAKLEVAQVNLPVAILITMRSHSSGNMLEETAPELS